MPVFRRDTRRRLLAAMLGGIIAPALSGCAAWMRLPKLPATASGGYRLGPGDRLRVIVFGQTQLTATYDVDASGMIELPLAGPVRAAGRSTAMLGRAIARTLVARGILRHPAVAVEVRRYRPFSILGEVNRPDQYPFEPGMTVLAAVSRAGGFTYRAVESEVGVIRMTGGVPRDYRAPVSALVAPGDVIRVFQRHF